VFGDLHFLDAAMNPCPTRTIGMIWFRLRLESSFEYFNDKARTAEVLSADGTMGSAGDIGYGRRRLSLPHRSQHVHDHLRGCEHLPQECEDLPITHPKVADAAVFGVPNADLGEEVKAAVQLMVGWAPGPETEAELIAFCGQHLARQKVPRSIDFELELPRLPTGNLYKRVLRDRYWANRTSRII
jgi:long-chain acyl-CoA synthetase